MKKTALLFSAGWPLGGLEALALFALDKKGGKFDIISSGACIGSVIALTYSSSAKGMSGREVLEMCYNTTGLSDSFLELMIKFNPFYEPNPRNNIERLSSDLFS